LFDHCEKLRADQLGVRGRDRLADFASAHPVGPHPLLAFLERALVAAAPVDAHRPDARPPSTLPVGAERGDGVTTGRNEERPVRLEETVPAHLAWLVEALDDGQP